MAVSRRGFSIIEVLVAVVIASIAGMALMESASQGRRAYESGIRHRTTAEATALVALSIDSMRGAGEGDGAALLSSRYAIDNDAILQKLRSRYYEVKTERSHHWDGSTENNTTQKEITSVSHNAIEVIMIRTNGITTSLYGLSGEGW